MSTPEEKSLEKLSMLENAYALEAMSSMEGFLEWSTVSPILYLARYQAEKVPQENVEAALFSSFEDVHASILALLHLGGDHWRNMDIMDDMLASLAWMYTLANRLGHVSSYAVDVISYHEIVMQVMLKMAARAGFRK